MPRRAFVPTGLTVQEKDDIRLGRTGWTWADYLAAGRAEFDEIRTASGPAPVGQRDHYARAFADLWCPRSKRTGSANV